MEEQGKPKSKLSWGVIALLLLAALVADLLSLIPLVGIVTGPLFWICVNIYLWHAGFGIVNVRRLATGALSMLAEIIPLIQEFPLVIVGIVIVIVFLKFEEKTGISATKKGAHLNHGGQRIPTPSKPPPRYSDGVGRPTGGPAPANNIIKVDFGDRRATSEEDEDLEKAA